MNKEEFIKKMIEKTIRIWITSTLRSEQFSNEHLGKPEKMDKVEKAIEKIISKISNDFIIELKKRDYIEKPAPQKEFNSILRSVFEKYREDYDKSSIESENK